MRKGEKETRIKGEEEKRERERKGLIYLSVKKNYNVAANTIQCEVACVPTYK